MSKNIYIYSVRNIYIIKNIMRPEGFEPPTFGSGIRRAAVAPWPHTMTLFNNHMHIKIIISMAETGFEPAPPKRLEP